MTDPVSQQEAQRILSVALDASEQRWEAHLREHQAHVVTHDRQHEHERDLMRHEEAALNAAFGAHEKEHGLQGEAAARLADGLQRALDAALEDHHREHAEHTKAHDREHTLVGEATDKAERQMDKRLEAMNDVYTQMREQARLFASAEIVEALSGQIDRRFDEARRERELGLEALRSRIEALEKGDVKQEGRERGMGTMVAAIVTTVVIVGGVLSAIVVVMNLVTP